MILGMNECITAHCQTRRRSPLLRRIDGRELPAAGTWDIPGNHATIAFSTPRTLRRLEGSIGRASGATVHVSDDPDQVAVSVSLEVSGLASAGCAPVDSPTLLDVRAVGGRDPWTMSGRLFTATSVSAVSADLTYNGIWHGGRGDRDYAWFVLAGVIHCREGRRHRRPRFAFQLLAYGPDDDIATRDAPRDARQGFGARAQIVSA
jgi:hypothetical protein